MDCDTRRRETTGDCSNDPDGAERTLPGCERYVLGTKSSLRVMAITAPPSGDARRISGSGDDDRLERSLKSS
jgi:hypothetical protein